MLISKVEFIKILNLSRPGVRRSFIFVEPLHLANYQISRTSEFIELLNSSKSRIHGNLKFIEFFTGSRSSPSRSSIVKVIDRPTQTLLCGFAVAAHGPLKFCSDEHIFERFPFLYDIIGGVV